MNSTTKLVGFLLVNKPAGITSFDCIRRLQRIFGKQNKIGHAGTLDPFATGLLIVAIGREATKHIQQIMELDKEYVATGKMGELTDTFDPEGKIVESCSIPNIYEKDFEEIFKKFMPSYTQTPPVYSALKHNGQRLYDIARKGKTSQEELDAIIARKQRTIQIHALELLELDLPYFKIRVHVSHGTYIRSLVNDIARALGSCATTFALERTQIGPFKVADAVELPEKGVEVHLNESIISVDDFLGKIKESL